MVFRYKTFFILLAFIAPTVWGQSALPISEPKESVDLYRDAEHWIRERFRWYRDQRLMPGEQIPEGVREAAAGWKQRMSVYTPPVSLSKGSTASMWTNVGPANIGGRITGIAVHPTNPDLVYFTGADGGVWKSTNGGAVFSPIADQLPTMSMGAIAISSAQPEVLLVGSGEANGSGDCYGGLGAFWSYDAGATWVTAGAKFANNIAELVIHATIPSIILAATREGLYRSIDAGGTWNRLRSGLVYDVIQHPTQPSVFFATANGAGVLRSSDHGATWSTLSVGVAVDSIGRSAIDICRSQPQVMYCVIVAAKGSSGLKALVKSIDGGLTWTRINTTSTPNFFGSQGWYNIDLAVDPSNPDRLLIGGVGLYLSINGGQTWSSRSGIHVDHHAIRFSPSHPNICYDGNDGGFYRSTDGGTTFQNLNQNLPITQFYELGIHQTWPHLMIGGTQDNGTKRRNQSSSDWLQATGGDGGYAIIDPTDTNYVYAEYQNGSHTRSTDGGRTFTSINKGLVGSGPWVTPVAIHPINTSVLFTCTNKQLYKTTNRGTLWFPYHGNMDSSSSIRIITIDPARPDHMLVGTTAGKVWYSTNGGGFWSSISTGLPNRTITDLQFDPTRDSVMYATCSGYFNGGVYKTVNAGGNWTSISGNLPSITKNTIQVIPHDPDLLFVGTDLGCYASQDGGLSWSVLSQGMPNVVVVDLEYQQSSGLLRAATHGRSIYELQVAVPVELLRLSAEVLGEDVRISWQTAQEAGNHGFVIERRIGDQGSWMEMGFVPGHGTTSALSSYEYLDRRAPREQILWYRLRQMDEDGSQDISRPVSVQASLPGHFRLEAPYPVPTEKVMTIPFTLESEGNITLSILDMAGRIVKTLVEGAMSSGSHVISTDLGNLPSGSYRIMMQAGSRRVIRGFIKW